MVLQAPNARNCEKSETYLDNYDDAILEDPGALDALESDHSRVGNLNAARGIVYSLIPGAVLWALVIVTYALTT